MPQRRALVSRMRLGLLAAVAVTTSVVVAPVVGRGASAANATTELVADSYVRADKPTGSFGRASNLAIAGRPLSIAYLRFSVTVPDGATVARATLQLFPSSTTTATFTVHGVANTTWSETATTYANAPTIRASVAASSVARRGTGPVSVDVASLVTRSGLVSLAVKSRAPLSFRSRESSFGRPRLVLEISTAEARGARGIGTGANGAESAGAGGAPPPQPAEHPVIAAAGDIACDPGNRSFNGGVGTPSACRQLATSNLLVGAGLAGVLILGDVQYECGGAGAFLRSYDPSWGRVKDITYPVPGNHEYMSSDGTDCDASGSARGYFGYFGSRAGDPAKGYYSFDIGSWHLIALNSNCSVVGGCHAGSPQERWLRADLAAHPAACTLAFWHHPRFSSGTHGSSSSMAAMWQTLYDFDAEVVLSGHDHNYERFAPQAPDGRGDPAHGVRQFVVGTGGKHLRSMGPPIANSEVRESSTHGVLELTLDPTSYAWQFVPEEGGTFADAGSASCH